MSGPADNDKSFERVLASFLREDLGPSRQDCPHPGVLATYFEGKLAEPEARRLEAHLSQCSRCQAEAAVLVRLPPEPTAETGRGEPVVAPPVVAAPPEPSPEPENVAPPARPSVEAMRVQAEDVDEPRPVEDLRRWRRERDSRRRRRRTLWTWLGPVALAASAVLAISVTYQFTPLIEYASRRSREPGSTARVPESARERGANRGTSAGEALEAPQADLTTPTTAASPPAPTEPDEMQGAGPESAPPESQSRQEAEAISPAPARVEPQANAGPTASSPARLARRAEPSETTEAIEERNDERQLEREPRFADRAAPLPAGPAKEERDAALAKAAEAGVIIVAHTNADVAWRIGDDSIERSDDGGKTWRAQPADGAAGLLVGSAPSASVCWLAGRSGLVLRTTDGEHWKRLAPPTTGDLTEIEARNESNATVRAASGERFSTRNGGQSWSKR